MPPIVSIRVAKRDDALDVARVHVRAWQVGYRGLLPDEYLSALRPEDRAARYTLGSLDPSAPATVVAEQNGAIVGFATVGAARDGGVANTGEILALYVDPSTWGLGIGRSLMCEARVILNERGFNDAILWLLEGNHRARQFYERDGWRHDDCLRTEEVWGIRVNELRFRRRLP